MNERGNLYERQRVRAWLTIIATRQNMLIPYTGWVYKDSLFIGQPFAMATREAGMVLTDPVQTVKTIQEKTGGREIVRFRTRNSEYELETEELNGD